MKHWIAITACAFCCALSAGSACGAERSALWVDFDRELDYTRFIRTAQGARHWEIVPERGAAGNRVLRVTYRFDQPGENSLLVFDLVPVTLSKITMRVRLPKNVGGAVRAHLAANAVGGGGYEGWPVTLNSKDGWTELELDLSAPLAGIYANGKRTDSNQLKADEQQSLALERLLLHLRLPDSGGARTGKAFVVDFDLLEGFAPQAHP